MSSIADTSNDDLGDAATDDKSELRLADPDNYNVSRRLRQLHDAKERVRDRKDDATRLEVMGELRPDQRDQLVAEVVIDYVRELQPLLAERDAGDDHTLEDALLAEDVDAATTGHAVTVGEFIGARGRVADDGSVAHYALSMAVWHVSNRYFQRIAGVDFESDSMPHDAGSDNEGFDST